MFLSQHLPWTGGHLKRKRSFVQCLIFRIFSNFIVFDSWLSTGAFVCSLALNPCITRRVKANPVIKKIAQSYNGVVILRSFITHAYSCYYLFLTFMAEFILHQKGENNTWFIFIYTNRTHLDGKGCLLIFTPTIRLRYTFLKTIRYTSNLNVSLYRKIVS